MITSIREKQSPMRFSYENITLWRDQERLMEEIAFIWIQQNRYGLADKCGCEKIYKRKWNKPKKHNRLKGRVQKTSDSSVKLEYQGMLDLVK